jgi:hypothetical protein
VKAGETVFRLALQSDLVALALEGSRFAAGRDIANHKECVSALTAMVRHSLRAVIDDSLPDENKRSLLPGVRHKLG